MALLDQFGHPLPPVSTSRMTARASRDAGAYRGSISGWRGPQVHSPEGESRERAVMQRRAADLAANDWAAHSAVEAISGNAIGTGLVPKASIPADMLGISSESARELGKRMEWAFALWTSEADVRGQCHFADLQNLGLRTMLSLGEMLHLAVMLNEKERERQNRTFSLALQTLSPARLMTPSDQQSDPFIRDGVRLSEYGRPEGYWLATPKASPQSSFVSVERSALLAADFTYVPARVGHRPGVFHLFRHETDEQVRGVSAFSKGIELFRNLSDAISYELFAQVIAASFPVFVALENGGVQLPDYVTEGREGDGERRERQLVQDLSPGQVLYGNENEKPYVLESKRPSANFSAFVEIVLRATAASVADERLLQDQLFQRPRRAQRGVEALQLLPQLVRAALLPARLRDGHRGGIPSGHVRASERRARLLRGPQILVQRGLDRPLARVRGPGEGDHGHHPRAAKPPHDLRRGMGRNGQGLRRGLRPDAGGVSSAGAARPPEPEHQARQAGQGHGPGGRRKAGK